MSPVGGIADRRETRRPWPAFDWSPDSLLTIEKPGWPHCDETLSPCWPSNSPSHIHPSCSPSLGHRSPLSLAEGHLSTRQTVVMWGMSCTFLMELTLVWLLTGSLIMLPKTLVWNLSSSCLTFLSVGIPGVSYPAQRPLVVFSTQSVKPVLLLGTWRTEIFSKCFAELVDKLYLLSL